MNETKDLTQTENHQMLVLYGSVVVYAAIFIAGGYGLWYLIPDTAMFVAPLIALSVLMGVMFSLLFCLMVVIEIFGWVWWFFTKPEPETNAEVVRPGAMP